MWERLRELVAAQADELLIVQVWTGDEQREPNRQVLMEIGEDHLELAKPLYSEEGKELYGLDFGTIVGFSKETAGRVFIRREMVKRVDFAWAEGNVSPFVENEGKEA